MKNIYKLLTAVLCAVLLTACDGLMDTHKEFIKDGEIIYAPLPDTIYFYAGKNRVQLNYKLVKSYNVKSMNVTWSNGQDLKSFPLEINESEVEGSEILDGLTEKAYTFNVTLVDAYGHTSLVKTGFGRSYGDRYQATILPRKVSSMQAENGKGIIEWMPAGSGFQYNEVKYTNKDDREITVESTSSTLELPDVKAGSSVSYRSFFVPEANCIDLFHTDWINSADDGQNFPHEYTMQEVPRNDWKILFCDSDQNVHGENPDGAGADGVLDGDANTFWHSTYNGENIRHFPMTFVFDMGKPEWIGRVGGQSRQDSFYTKGIIWYITTDEEYKEDGSNQWIRIASSELAQNNDMQWADVANRVLEQAVKGRYLKMEIVSGYSGTHLAALAEVMVQRVTAIDGENIHY